MRFGTYVLAISREPKDDFQVIENALREAELAEEIDMDAVWLLEHHFGGDVAYADPVVFAAAVAMRTRRVRIGFAVVQGHLHHPVRLAAQTALLDNLSHGRLIVGVGRGSSFNEYEYIGFGTPMGDSRMMLPEAENLLVKAWTSENVRHEGRFWNVSFPILRPRPYQQPHPPLVRACLSEQSVVEMARIGRPVLLGVQTVAEQDIGSGCTEILCWAQGSTRQRLRRPWTRPGPCGSFTWQRTMKRALRRQGPPTNGAATIYGKRKENTTPLVFLRRSPASLPIPSSSTTSQCWPVLRTG